MKRALLLVLPLWAACRECKEGTVLVAYTLVGAAQGADQLTVVACTGVVNKDRRCGSRGYDNPPASGTIEVDFSAGYPAGSKFDVIIAVYRADNPGVILAQGSSGPSALAASCARLDVAVMGTAASVEKDPGADMSQVGDMAQAPFPNPNCVGMAKTCGAQNNDDCCSSLLMPGGACNRWGDNRYPATVSSFRLDRYEITVGRFRKFVEAGYGTQAKPPTNGSGANLMKGTGWQDDGKDWNKNLPQSTAALKMRLADFGGPTWTDAVGANENLPVNWVTWYMAFAFCVWDGGRLPTVAEWSYAAAGGAEQRKYPWGASVDATYAVYGGAPIAPVGSKSPQGDGKWGHSDLAGNLWEWNFDSYPEFWEPPNQCTDCSDIRPSSSRVFIGNSWKSPDPRNGAGRTGHEPEGPFDDLGARCARSP